jgi:hypothetical protein
MRYCACGAGPGFRAKPDSPLQQFDIGWRISGMNKIAIEILAEDMFQLVSECAGKKNLKAGDITKAMIAKHGEQACSKDDCKQAIRLLIDSGRCVYSYLGGSYIQLPPKEGTI